MNWPDPIRRLICRLRGHRWFTSNETPGIIQHKVFKQKCLRCGQIQFKQDGRIL